MCDKDAPVPGAYVPGDSGVQQPKDCIPIPEKKKKKVIKEKDKPCGPEPPERDCVEEGPPKTLFIMDPNDPYSQERAKCLKDCHVVPLYNILLQCTARVNRKLKITAENCHPETIDLVEAMDKCVKSKGFNRLV